ncbi:MAG: hypothetical protein H0W25_17815 [Acidimicrobiia bacterium]|nr:hypothetical protein [Acidimicrobiia bacterium]
MDEAGEAHDGTVVAIEQWFTRRGTPHLIEQYSAAEDIFTRALPFFTVVFLLECTVALSLEWTWWQNTLAVVGGLALLIGIWAGVNRIRHEPAFSRPARVGRPEVLTFVFGPPVVIAVFGQPAQAGEVALVNLLLLGLVYVVTSYGVIPLVRWAGNRVFHQLGEVGGLLARALPLLLVFVTFLFLTPEVWEVAGSTSWPLLAVNTGLFALLGIVFLLARVPTETARLSGFDDLVELRRLCEGTPAEGEVGGFDAPPVDEPLRKRQRGNLYLVILVNQAIQLVLVSVVVGLFFVVFGVLSVRPDVAARWVNDPGATEAYFEFMLLGRGAVVTPALLKVAAFLAGFTGFYVAVYAVTDQAYREQFFDRIAAELRQTLAVRAVYLAVRTAA